MNPFTAITSKIFAGVSALLLIALIVAGLTIRHKNAVIETQRNVMAETAASLRFQSAAVERAAQQTRQQQQAFADATEEGRREIEAIQPQLVILRRTPGNTCRTPREVMEAGL